MSKSKFNPHKEIRIDRVKAHHSYLRPRKPTIHHRDEKDYADYHDSPPWELGAIKNLQKGPPKFKKCARGRPGPPRRHPFSLIYSG